MQFVRSYQILCLLRDICRPSAAEAPGLPAYPAHRKVHPSELRLLSGHPQHTSPDGAPVSSARKHSLRTWTYDLRCKLPSPSASSDRSPVPMTMPPSLVCNIHQHLCPLPRLAVFISYTVIFRIMSDVPEMNIHRICDRHLAQGCSKLSSTSCRHSDRFCLSFQNKALSQQ